MKSLTPLCGLLCGLAMLACSTDDRMEDYWPEPERRTGVFFGGVQEAMSLYWHNRGELPEDLTALGAGLEHHAVVDVDGWGNEMRYVAVEHGYCLSSAGPDSLFGTSDDLAIAGEIRDSELVQYAAQSDEARERCRE